MPTNHPTSSSLPLPNIGNKREEKRKSLVYIEEKRNVCRVLLIKVRKKRKRRGFPALDSIYEAV